MTTIPARLFAALCIGAGLAAMGAGALATFLTPLQPSTTLHSGPAQRIEPTILDRPNTRQLIDAAMRSGALASEDTQRKAESDGAIVQAPRWRLTGILETMSGDRVAMFSLGARQPAMSLRAKEKTPDGRIINSIEEQHVTLIDPSTQCEETITLFEDSGMPPCEAANGTTEASSQ